jgi:hypothetical protein
MTVIEKRSKKATFNISLTSLLSLNGCIADARPFSIKEEGPRPQQILAERKITFLFAFAQPFAADLDSTPKTF